MMKRGVKNKGGQKQKANGLDDVLHAGGPVELATG
jgi:hypothetical protein